MAFGHPGLAGRFGNGEEGIRSFLPDFDSRYGSRHHLLLGCPDDHGRARIQGKIVQSRAKKIPDEEIPNRIPFRHVYFTGIIRDAEGRKMSKSLGNSPDPLDLIEKYGADGLRHGIMSIAPKGQDIRFSEERIEQGRNFCNKLWNVCRFRLLSGDLVDNTSMRRLPVASIPSRSIGKIKPFCSVLLKLATKSTSFTRTTSSTPSFAAFTVSFGTTFAISTPSIRRPGLGMRRKNKPALPFRTSASGKSCSFFTRSLLSSLRNFGPLWGFQADNPFNSKTPETEKNFSRT